MVNTNPTVFITEFMPPVFLLVDKQMTNIFPIEITFNVLTPTQLQHALDYEQEKRGDVFQRLQI